MNQHEAAPSYQKHRCGPCSELSEDLSTVESLALDL